MATNHLIAVGKGLVASSIGSLAADCSYRAGIKDLEGLGDASRSGAGSGPRFQPVIMSITVVRASGAEAGSPHLGFFFYSGIRAGEEIWKRDCMRRPPLTLVVAK